MEVLEDGLERALEWVWLERAFSNTSRASRPRAKSIHFTVNKIYTNGIRHYIRTM